MYKINNDINWFEIPVLDIDRAVKFYNKILDYEIKIQNISGVKMGFFPAYPNAVGGALVQGDWYKPSSEGTTVFLNAGIDLNPILNKIKKAGGEILLPKTKISDEFGYFAFFIDSEGNRVGLHNF